MDNNFYDQLAESYHLIFQDWEASMQYQADVLSRLLPGPRPDMTILDCACGIGTQAIGLAMRGFRVEGSDPSPASIARAVREAAARKLSAVFRVDDMRTLSTARRNAYDAVIAFDNAIPHLHSDEEILDALSNMRDRLRSGGIILISLRDYGPLLANVPRRRRRYFIATGSIVELFIKYGTGSTTAAMSSISLSRAKEIPDGKRNTSPAYIGRSSQMRWRNSHHVSDSRIVGS
jgi:SAM-dependent methyltransferase